MTAPELSDDELAVVERFDAGDDAPESVRERLANALFFADADAPFPASEEVAEHFRRLADAAIAVMRGPGTVEPFATWQEQTAAAEALPTSSQVMAAKLLAEMLTEDEDRAT